MGFLELKMHYKPFLNLFHDSNCSDY
jgi:hypothetical protein